MNSSHTASVRFFASPWAPWSAVRSLALRAPGAGSATVVAFKGAPVTTTERRATRRGERDVATRPVSNERTPSPAETVTTPRVNDRATERARRRLRRVESATRDVAADVRYAHSLEPSRLPTFSTSIN